MDGNNAFGAALQAALRMKRQEVDSARREFDGYSPWLQFSLKPDPAVVDVRMKRSSASSRLTLARETFLHNAVVHLAEDRSREACVCYFNVLALFRWVVNTNAAKKQVLRDEFIRHESFRGETPMEQQSIAAMCGVSLVSIAQCMIDTKEWDSAKVAASEAAEWDSSLVDAYILAFQAVVKDPRTVVSDHQAALKCLKGAVKQHSSSQALRDFYLLSLRQVSEAVDKERTAVRKMFAAPSLPVVGSSSSGAGGYIKLSFKEALVRSNEMRAVAEKLEAEGGEGAIAARDKYTQIRQSLEQHVVHVTATEGGDKEASDAFRSERSRKILDALYEQIRVLGSEEVAEEELLRLAVDQVRREEALEAAYKWIKHVKTPTIVSMLRTRGFEFPAGTENSASFYEAEEEDSCPLFERPREELILALSTLMAADIVELVRDEADRGSAHELDLFARLMERYEDPKAGAILDGVADLSVGDFVRIGVAAVVVIYLVVMFYWSFSQGKGVKYNRVVRLGEM